MGCNQSSSPSDAQQRTGRYAGNDGGGGGGGGGDAGGSIFGADVKVLDPVHKDIVGCLAAGRPDEVISGSEDKAIAATAWQAAGGAQQAQRWAGHTRGVNSLSYGPATDMLFSGSRDLTVRGWRRSGAEEGGNGGNGGNAGQVVALEGHDLTISSVVFDESRNAVWSGSRDTSVRLWDVEAGKQTRKWEFARNLVTCMCLASGGKGGGGGGGAIGGGGPEQTVLQGAEDLHVRVWDARQAGLRAAATLGGYVYFPLCIDMSSDGNRFVTGSKGFDGVGCEIKVWDLRAGKVLHEMTGHQQDVTGCIFLDGGGGGGAGGGSDRVVSVSKDMTVKVWDASAGGAALHSHSEEQGGPFTHLVAAAPGSKASFYASTIENGIFVYETAPDEGGRPKLVARTPPPPPEESALHCQG